MDITLTKDQYENLMKLVYLGGWLVNSFRTEPIKEFDDLQNHIYSYAKDAGLEKYVVFDEATGEYFPSDILDDSVDDYIEAYNEDNFWEDLVRSLGQRDFVRHYGRAAIEEMKSEELVKREDPFIQKYAKEFEQHGLRHLGLIKLETE